MRSDIGKKRIFVFSTKFAFGIPLPDRIYLTDDMWKRLMYEIKSKFYIRKCDCAIFAHSSVSRLPTNGGANSNIESCDPIDCNEVEIVSLKIRFICFLLSGVHIWISALQTKMCPHVARLLVYFLYRIPIKNRSQLRAYILIQSSVRTAYAVCIL